MPANGLHISSVARLPPEQLSTALASLTEADADDLLHDWSFFARPEQVAPEGQWTTWLFLAGRGAGKTRSGAEWIRDRVKAGFGRMALIAPTAADARDVMVEGSSGVLGCGWRNDRDHRGNPVGLASYEPSKRRLTWANGAIATLFSAEEPDRLRGPQHDGAWCDEVAAWANPSAAWDMAMLGLRLGQNPQAMVSTTPRPIPLLKNLLADPACVVTRAATRANRANLALAFLSQIASKYEGTRLGRQELEGELLEDIEGALWTYAAIDRNRIAAAALPKLQRIVIAVDPSGCAGREDERSDEIGIVAVGRDMAGLGYVLDDASGHYSPEGWAKTAVHLYDKWGADRIVGERNYGGAMVESTIRAHRRNAPVKLVTASRGKAQRAEPIAALYEQDRVKHAGTFPALEDQLCAFAAHGYQGDRSPDRADAAIWGLTEAVLGASSYGMLDVI